MRHPEFWLNQNDQERYQALALQNGFPSVFYQFLANCCHANLQDRVTPFPQTSAIAALWFVLQGFQAQLIYLDASHAYDDVRRDTDAYWDLLEPGGVMFGDDYLLPDVAQAVNDFASAREMVVEERKGFWILRRQLVAAESGEWVPSDEDGHEALKEHRQNKVQQSLRSDRAGRRSRPPDGSESLSWQTQDSREPRC